MSCGIFASMQGLPSASRATTDSIGSTRCSLSEAIARATASSLRSARVAGSSKSVAGRCRPKYVSVCVPSGTSPRIEGSVSEWQ